MSCYAREGNEKPKSPWVQSRLHEWIFEIYFSFNGKHSDVLYNTYIYTFGQLIEYHSTERESPCNGLMLTLWRMMCCRNLYIEFHLLFVSFWLNLESRISNPMEQKHGNSLINISVDKHSLFSRSFQIWLKFVFAFGPMMRYAVFSSSFFLFGYHPACMYLFSFIHFAWSGPFLIRTETKLVTRAQMLLKSGWWRKSITKPSTAQFRDFDHFSFESMFTIDQAHSSLNSLYLEMFVTFINLYWRFCLIQINFLFYSLKREGLWWKKCLHFIVTYIII